MVKENAAFTPDVVIVGSCAAGLTFGYIAARHIAAASRRRPDEPDQGEKSLPTPLQEQA